MSTSVLVNGASGRMGALAATTIEAEPTLSLAGRAGTHDNLAEMIEEHKPDVVLDLTVASCVYENAATIINAGVSPVIGTSGLHSEQVDELRLSCDKQQLGGLIVPNFSIGAVLMMKFARLASHYLNNAEIIEMHHTNKQDAPSGTAIATAQGIANARQSEPDPLTTRETIPHARGATYQNVPIHSLRIPGKIAHQQVIFGGSGETLTITHDSIDRACFMPGVVLACQKVSSLDTLHSGLDVVLSC